MRYQRFKKRWSGSKKSVFGKKKSVQKKLNKKIKTDFPGKSTFFESPITHKRFIFEHSYISYRKRQKSCTLIVIYVILSYLTSPIFNSPSKSTGFFFAKEEVQKTKRKVCFSLSNFEWQRKMDAALQTWMGFFSEAFAYYFFCSLKKRRSHSTMKRVLPENTNLLCRDCFLFIVFCLPSVDPFSGQKAFKVKRTVNKTLKKVVAVVPFFSQWPWSHTFRAT